jgi:hypothetical protein
MFNSSRNLAVVALTLHAVHFDRLVITGVDYSASNACIESVVSDSDPCLPKQNSSVNLSPSSALVEPDTRRLVSID